MSDYVPAIVAVVPLVAWVILYRFRGGFWRADRRLADAGREPTAWPAVAAVIPARNEAATVGKTVASLLAQDYPGPFSVTVVDDQSDDGTRAAAMAADDASGRLEIVTGKPLAEGWTGKLWAVEQGIRHARSVAPGATYLLLTDADIEHDAGNLRRLVAKAEAEKLDLVSLMARLCCETFWERLLIPAFVFFFQKLYPFPWVNDPERGEAAAAGGCMLIRRAALERCGGIASIRDRIIDDCALAARIKGQGPIWLGLAQRTRSLRGYHRLADIWTMVARTAFAQLDHSVLALAGVVAAMVVVYGLPPAMAIFGLFEPGYATFVVATIAWAIMMQAYRPTLRLYGLKPWRASLLPVAALLFTLMTVDSARRYRKGKGGAWKGRHYGWLRKADG